MTDKSKIQHINRRLRHGGQAGYRLKTTRGFRSELELVKYYILDVLKNFLVEKDVDLNQKMTELKG